MKIKELLEKYFKEAMTDDALKEIETLFESSVNEKVKLDVDAAITAKETELEEKNVAELETFKTELIEKLNEFTKVAATEFVEENKTSIEAGIKTEIAEKAIETLKTVFTEAHVEIPESEKDVVKALEEKVESANKMLSKEVLEKVEAQKQCFEYEKVIKFNEMTASLSDVKREKVLGLTEGLMFNDIEDFETKVKIVMEKIVENKGNKENLNENQDDFEFEVDAYLP